MLCWTMFGERTGSRISVRVPAKEIRRAHCEDSKRVSDCIAYKGERRIRIEFEFQSSRFVQHGHDPSKCDWIVCWKHNSYNIPKRIKVIELRPGEFGHGLEVWVKPVGSPYKEHLAKAVSDNSWSVPSQANEGDLVLYYANGPEKAIADLFAIDGKVDRVQRVGNRESI